MTIKHDGKKYRLTQEAYIAGADTYRAAARRIPDDGYGYTVLWDKTGDTSDGDEGNACDWYNPSNVVRV